VELFYESGFIFLNHIDDMVSYTDADVHPLFKRLITDNKLKNENIK